MQATQILHHSTMTICTAHYYGSWVWPLWAKTLTMNCDLNQHCSQNRFVDTFQVITLENSYQVDLAVQVKQHILLATYIVRTGTNYISRTITHFVAHSSNQDYNLRDMAAQIKTCLAYIQGTTNQSLPATTTSTSPNNYPHNRCTKNIT